MISETTHLSNMLNDICFEKSSVSSDPINSLKLAKIAISNRLYVNKWTLRSELEKIKNYESYDIVMAKYNDKPVGVGVARSDSGFANIFILKKYRRNGIGSAILKLLKTNRNVHFRYGVKGSEKFFSKHDIICFN